VDRLSLTHVRLALAVLGFGLALVSIAFDNHTLAWVAIGVLSGSLLLRLIVRRRAQQNGDKAAM
jgi:hypothetical protein